MWSLQNIANNIHNWLFDTFNPSLALLLEFVFIGALAIGLFSVLGLVLILMERKVSAWMQLRLGPKKVACQIPLQRRNHDFATQVQLAAAHILGNKIF